MSEAKVNKITRLEVSKSIKSLGIVSGDILYIRADLGKIGRLAGPAQDVVIGGIMDVLGLEGTLIVPTFTKLSKIWHRNIVVFNESSPSITGALSNRLLLMENIIRSKHPTHSFAAIGRYAKHLLNTHNETEPCFEPMRRLVELKGKMMIIGCVEESPGFSTAHLAQYDLRLSQKHYLKYFFKSKIEKEGNQKNYWPDEAPGCSKGFAKFYVDYKESRMLNSGFVGDAFSICADADKTFELEKKILNKNPRYALCDDFTCVSCHLTRGYNKRNIPRAILSHLMRLIKILLK